jgi:hypothetical protein
MTAFVSFLQFPFWMMSTMAIRKLIKSEHISASEQIKGEDFLWISSLAVSDPMGVLAIVFFSLQIGQMAVCFFI